MKKFMSLLLSIVMVFSCLSCLTITSASAGAVDDIISIARSQKGYYGTPNKFTYWYGSVGGTYGYAWCATFVSWCANQAGISTEIIPKHCSCNTGMNWFKNKGLWQNGAYYGGSYTPKAGDIVYYGTSLTNSNHVGIVTGINGQYLTVIEGNTDASVAEYTANSKRKLNSSYVLGYGTPNYPSQEPANNPVGTIDSITAGPNSVTIGGWAFDEDDLSAQLNIHVYIGGDSNDSNAEGHGDVYANTKRSDVNNVYGCGNYHGIAVTVPTRKTGVQSVYVYAINVGSGSNKLIGSGTVNIPKDTEAPTISRTYLSEITKDGYRVCCETKDNVGIRKVRIATWTQSDQSDIVWHDANNNGYGTWYIDLKRSDYSDSRIYYNHIYVYDYADNYAFAVRDMVYEANGPEITNQTVSNISDGGFRFTCKVTDDTKVSSVKIAVWTQNNGQDDLKWYDLSLTGDVASRYIYASDHNNETGSYIIHTYAYDKYDNCSGTGITTTVGATPLEVSSVDYNGSTYKVYSSGMNWDEAKNWCEEQGGHLATITTEDEWNNVKSLLEKFNGVRCWLGAESTSGEWKWVTNEKFEFSNWSVNQPDCSGNVEYYLGTFDSESEILDCYLWNDYSNIGSKIGGFVMEMESPIEELESCVWDDGVITSEATCVATGIKLYTCVECGKTKTEIISAIGHTIIADKRIEPKCEDTGLTVGSHCSVCKEILIKQEVILATGHTQVVDEAVASSCTQTGLTEGEHCSECGEILVAQKIVSENGHKVVVDEAVPPTLTETGLTEGKHCSVCGEVLVAQEVLQPIVVPTSTPTTEPTEKTTQQPTQGPTVAPTNTPVKIGDVDEDGIVNIFDATKIQLYIAKYATLSDTQMIAADADKDGIVNIFDVTRIQLYLAKYITEL